MKIQGLDLDNSPLIAQDKSLRYAENIAIGEGGQSYVNEDGFQIDNSLLEELDYEFSNGKNITIIGTIPTNIGVVLFAIYGSLNLIIYIENEIKRTIIYSTSDNSLNFNYKFRITGDYIYNYKNELIVTFTEGIDDEANETRIINITNPTQYAIHNPHISSEQTDYYEITDVSQLNLIPDVEYPTINVTVDDGGNLRTGAYQIAISYKLFDGSYTNYSILSVPTICCGKYGEDYAPNVEINRKITVSFDKPDVSFNTYKLAIVHITDTTQLVYETEDIKLINGNNQYIISRLDNYSLITLDDIFIKNIAYIKDQVLTNYNNRLIRGNVKTLDLKNINDDLKTIVENDIVIDLKAYDNLDPYNNNFKYFKSGEIYCLYAGFLDYKGDLINIYEIPTYYTENGETKKGLLIPDSLLVTGDINNNHVYFDDFYQSGTNESFKNPLSWKPYKTDVFEIDVNEESDTTIAFLYNNTNSNINIKFLTRINITNLPPAKIPTAGGGYVDFDYHTINVTIENNGIKNERPTIVLRKNSTTLTIEDNISIKANSSISYRVLISISNFHDPELDKQGSLHFINTPNCYIPTISLNDTNFTDLIQRYVKSVVYFYIEHNTYNSRVLSQALCIPDTNSVNFATNQQYEGQFKGKYALRFYPFEYLYNKVSKLKTKVKWNYNIGMMQGSTDTTGKISFPLETPFHGSLEKTYSVICWDDDKSESSGFESNGVQILDCDKKDLQLLNTEINKEVILEYTSSDNTSQQNIAGDSYYRTKDLTIADYPTLKSSDDDDLYYDGICIADLLNPAENLYDNTDNQKLQIASPIIPVTYRESIELIGDTYLSYLTLRVTTPSKAFRYGDSEHNELDSNSTVFRWILTFPIESKYNIAARYSDNIIDKPYFLHNAILQKYVELIGASYKVDNYINTSVGKGYNPVYNENGIENFTYFKDIPGTPDHPHRIIRSEKQSPESISLNWRLFRSDNYKDMPFNRGEIVSLKTDNKNLYIQQKYGLHLLQQRDQLNNDNTGSSYLGTSDLFNMEPKEIMYSPSGYIGCNKYEDTNINVSGYVVIDADHKKIFLINGDKPMEISNIKTKEFFNKFISDNPDAKRIINYNEDRNLLYISQSNSEIEKTMSFSPIHKVWVSFHTYLPDEGFSNRNGLFWLKNGDIFKPISNNNKGLYFNNEVNKSIIQFILNENTVYNKLIKTIVWKDVVSQKSGNYTNYFFDDTINNIMIHNDYQCTGLLDVDGSIKSKDWWDGSKGTNKVNLWRFNQICDIVLNPRKSFMKNAITPDKTNLKINPKWYDINRFICQYVYTTMWFNNENPSKEWEIIDINPEYTLDNRNDQTHNNQDNNKQS